MHAVFAWIVNHPKFCGAILWPIVTACLVFVFHPRSEEELAAMNPRVAASLKLLAALGIDPIRATEAIKELVARKGTEEADK